MCSSTWINMDEDSIKNELTEISLGDIKELREKVGIKKFNSAFSKQHESVTKLSENEKFKRPNKHRPREMSSKKRVTRLRQVVDVRKKQEVRDPRFDERCGHLNKDLFSKSFDFLKDMKERERKEMHKAMLTTKDPMKKERLQKKLKKAEESDRNVQQKSDSNLLDKEHKMIERELVKTGKKPFYISKALKRKVLLAQKYKELKSSGKLSKFLSKKRKKNASRDRRRLPPRS